jgi:predicted neuraminidase
MSFGEFDGRIRQSSPHRQDALLRIAAPSSHAPFLLRSTTTSVLHCVWFSGDREGAPGNGIAHASLGVGGQQWSATRILVKDDRCSMQNPVLIERDGQLILLHTRQDAGPLGVSQRTSDVLLWTSSDDGATWSDAPVVVFARGIGAFIRAPTMQCRDADQLLLPMYFTPAGEFDHGQQFSAVVRSAVGSATEWETTQLFKMPGSQGAVGVQPNLVRIPNTNIIVALMRNRTGGQIMRSTSTDEGKNWTRLEPTNLPSNNSSIAVCALQDGRVVVAFNNSKGARFPLTLAFSRDAGLSFYRARDIVDHEIMGGGQKGPQKNSYQLYGEHSYPSILLEQENGAEVLHIAFTHCRETIGYIRLIVQHIADEGDDVATCGSWTGEQ